MEPGYEGYTKTNVLETDLILIPVNINNAHWTPATLCCNEKVLKFYDSLGGEGGDFLDFILQYFASLTNTGLLRMDNVGYDKHSETRQLLRLRGISLPVFSVPEQRITIKFSSKKYGKYTQNND